MNEVKSDRPNIIFFIADAPIMLNGITEDSQSSKNMIDNNNINYFSGNAAVSEGQDSEVRGIVALKDRAHIQDQIDDYSLVLNTAALNPGMFFIQVHTACQRALMVRLIIGT